jgi:acyl-CoA thioester hydrolase
MKFTMNSELLTIASILVFVNMKTGRPTVPPDYVSEKILKM